MKGVIKNIEYPLASVACDEEHLQRRKKLISKRQQSYFRRIVETLKKDNKRQQSYFRRIVETLKKDIETTTIRLQEDR